MTQTAAEFLRMRNITVTEGDDIFAKNKGTFRYNPCRYCGKNFTQGHSLVEHQKYSCKNLITQPRPKVTGALVPPLSPIEHFFHLSYICTTMVNRVPLFEPQRRAAYCIYCGNSFTCRRNLVEHQKHSCKSMNKQPRPKVTCPGCNREVCKSTFYKHKRNGCPTLRNHRALPELEEVIERQVYWIGDGPEAHNNPYINGEQMPVPN